MKHIGFNKPYLTGKELGYIADSVASGKISGDGKYTQLCQDFFISKYGFKKCLLTTSCTDALEMASILIDVQPGDEIIAPSYTFVSTVNAFVLRGAKIIFCDSFDTHPCMDVNSIEQLITSKTKAIIPVHYAGISCDMDTVMDLANKYELFVIEDAAQAIDSYYKNRKGNKIPLGSIGHMSTFSFHETKNIISGEGGMLVINDESFIKRAEIIREKGTNRSAFWRGEVDKYNWVDIGSSFLPSDIIAAFLFAQLESLKFIQDKRLNIWNQYKRELQDLEIKKLVKLPFVPDYSDNNAHMFYLICSDSKERNGLIEFLREFNINAVFHYLSLHKSPFYIEKNKANESLTNADLYTECLVRLPFSIDLKSEQISFICAKISDFFSKR
jgi:dTDP-4-amino-4,6-dideoxygalactose transaminase